MKYFNVYKKRDGQKFKHVSEIFASNFDEAKKIFAQNMTKDNWEKSNNIVWLTEEEDRVETTGWYDLSSCKLIESEEGGTDYENSEMELFCSKKSIQEGFDSWSEDVYTWEVRDNLILKEYTVIGVVNEDFESPIYIDIIEAVNIERAIDKAVELIQSREDVDMECDTVDIIDVKLIP